MIDPLDRNKTALTHNITALASAYLDFLGCKPIETEVPLSNGTISDIASFTYPTMTELKKGKLLKHLVNNEILGDYKLATLFQYKYGGIITIAVEVKTSLSDFKKDLDKKYSYFQNGTRLTLPSHLNYLAVPLLLEEEVKKIYPAWGYIICGENRIKKVEPQWHINALHPYQIIDLVASVGIRRDHRTRYRAYRDWLKAYRVENYYPRKV